MQNQLNLNENEKMPVNASNNKNSNSDNQIGSGRLGKKLSPLFKKNKSSGYALILFVMFCFVLSVTFTKPIVLTAARQYRDTNLEYAKTVSERIGIATASPIRERINSTIYNRIQGKLINHTKLFLSDSDTYNCQGQLVATKKAGGKLSNVFSICDLNGIFDDMLGDTNQTIDFLGFLYPEHKTPLEDKNLDIVRKSITEQFQNRFDYTLRTIFVGQEVLVQPGTKKRTDRFRWQVRADVLTNTYYDVIDAHVLHYDVILDVVAHDVPFGGAGTACDRDNAQAAPDVLIDPPSIPYTGPDGITYIIAGDGGGVFPLNATDQDGHVHQYGTPGYDSVCGTLPNGKSDPYCGKQNLNNGECGSVYGGDINCNFSNGTSFSGYQAPESIRIITGCASPRTGQLGQRAGDLDPVGYNFVVTTRLVSVGSTFN